MIEVRLELFIKHKLSTFLTFTRTYLSLDFDKKQKAGHDAVLVESGRVNENNFPRMLLDL